MFKKRGKKFKLIHYKFTKAWSKYFKENLKDYIKQRYSKRQIKKEESSFQKEVLDYLILVFILGQENSNEEIKIQTMFWISFDIDNSDALEYAKKRAWELIKEVDKATRENIGIIINSWIDSNLPAWEISKRIFRRFHEYSSFRASLIATMELSNAYEIWKKKQFEKYTEHFWTTWFKRNVSEWDSSARESHIQNSRDGWIESDKLFSWTNTMHAPHGFNCRCDTVYSLFKPDSEEI